MLVSVGRETNVVEGVVLDAVCVFVVLFTGRGSIAPVPGLHESCLLAHSLKMSLTT